MFFSSALGSALLTAGLLAATAGAGSATPPAGAQSTDAAQSTGAASAASAATATSTASAAPATDPAAAADVATAAISDPSPIRGDSVVVTGTGFTPAEKVTASLPSRNQGQLGSGTADAVGRVAISVTVPSTLPDGDQEVLLTGVSGERASTGFRLRSMLADLLTSIIRWWPTR